MSPEHRESLWLREWDSFHKSDKCLCYRRKTRPQDFHLNKTPSQSVLPGVHQGETLVKANRETRKSTRGDPSLSWQFWYSSFRMSTRKSLPFPSGVIVTLNKISWSNLPKWVTCATWYCSDDQFLWNTGSAILGYANKNEAHFTADRMYIIHNKCGIKKDLHGTKWVQEAVWEEPGGSRQCKLPGNSNVNFRISAERQLRVTPGSSSVRTGPWSTGFSLS